MKIQQTLNVPHPDHYTSIVRFFHTTITPLSPDHFKLLRSTSDFLIRDLFYFYKGDKDKTREALNEIIERWDTELPLLHSQYGQAVAALTHSQPFPPSYKKGEN